MSDEDALVRSATAGDGSAFSQLVTMHKSRVFGLVARFTRDPYELDDIAQEVFLRAWRNLQQYRKDAPFEHWLSRIAVHACYDFLRKHRWSKQQISLEGIDLAEPDRSSATAARDILEAAMSHLKPDERLILTLVELEGQSIRATADLTGWTEANVKVRAHRARQALKEIITKQEKLQP
jgi:RNA polymerase sigma-70 factor (ECF subfamily)